MEDQRVYYHVAFSVTRGKPVFLTDEIDAAFKEAAREIARQKGWLLLEKAPWDDLSKMVGYLKGRTARMLLERFPWLRGDLNSYQFWNRSYHYSRHNDDSLATVRAYIRNQRKAGGLAE